MTHKAVFNFPNGRQIAVSFTAQKTTWESRDGDASFATSTARLPRGLSRKDKEAIKRCIAQDWSTRCQHSYDCCGRWYRDCNAHIVNRRLTLTVRNYKNI